MNSLKYTYFYFLEPPAYSKETFNEKLYRSSRRGGSNAIILTAVLEQFGSKKIRRKIDKMRKSICE